MGYVTVKKSFVPPKHYEKYVAISAYSLPARLFIIVVKLAGSVKVVEKYVQLYHTLAIPDARANARMKSKSPIKKARMQRICSKYLHCIILKHLMKMIPTRERMDIPMTAPYKANE